MPGTRTLALLLLVSPQDSSRVPVMRMPYLPSSEVSVLLGKNIGTGVAGATFTVPSAALAAPSLSPSLDGRSAVPSGSTSPPLIGQSACLFVSGDTARLRVGV